MRINDGPPCDCKGMKTKKRSKPRAAHLTSVTPQGPSTPHRDSVSFLYLKEMLRLKRVAAMVPFCTQWDRSDQGAGCEENPERASLRSIFRRLESEAGHVAAV